MKLTPKAIGIAVAIAMLLIMVPACCLASEIDLHPAIFPSSNNLSGVNALVSGPTMSYLPDGSLINDGSFELGPGGAWSETISDGITTKIYDPLSAIGVAAYDGTYALWIGGYSGTPNISFAEQSITIPANALFLKFRACYNRPDADDPPDIDEMIISIDGTVVATKEISQANETSPLWIKEVVDVHDYAGQTVTLRLEGAPTGAGTGNVFVDYITIDETFEQPPNPINYLGYPSYDNGTDSYMHADDFQLLEQRRITALYVGGGNINNTGETLANATALNFAIYADAGGVPAGYPGDGVTSPVWSLSVAPADSQVQLSPSTIQTPDISDVTLTLDSPVTLDAGVYWLCYYPTIGSGETFYVHTSLYNDGNATMFIHASGASPVWAPQFYSLGVAGSIQTEAVSSSPSPSGGGGGGGGGCFISTIN